MTCLGPAPRQPSSIASAIDSQFADVTKDEDVRRAIDLIYAVPVSPPEHRLLASFVRDSADAKAAALYVLNRAYGTSNGETLHDIDHERRCLLADWRELVTLCEVVSLSVLSNANSGQLVGSSTSIPESVSLQLSFRDQNRCCITGRSRFWWDMFGWSITVTFGLFPGPSSNL